MYTIVVVLLMSLQGAFATAFMVGPGESIQAAVNTAQDQDTVLIADGVYQESVVLYGRTLTVASHFLIDSDSSHIDNTMILPSDPGADTASCFVYGSGESLEGRLVGLTLADGRGTTALIQPEDRVGGCIHIKNSSVTIEDSRILGGRCFVGGGIIVEGTIGTPASASIVMDNVVVENCYADDSGGGVYVWWATAIVSNCVFESDSCPNLDGGLQCSRAQVEVDNSEFRHCYGWIGGMAMQVCTGHVRYSLFEENGAIPINFGQCHFASINAPIEFSGNTVRNGSTGHIAAGWAGDPAPSVFGNVFEGNTTTYLSATVLIGWLGGNDFAYNIVRDNQNNYGGAIQAYQETDAHIHHNLVENNRDLLINYGSAFICVSGCRPTLDSNLFIGNYGIAAGWGVTGETHLLDMRNNWWGDASGPYHPTLNPTGQGDTLVSDSILFIPWLTVPPDTTMPSAVSDREQPTVPSTWKVLGVYPNPFNSELTIDIAGFAGREFAITLHNILGQEVARIHEGQLTGGQLHYSAPPRMASGIYFLRASDRLQVETRKVVFLK